MKIDIFDTRYQINIVGSIVFEAKSFVGRILKLNKCPEDGSKLLHLGCGTNYFPEFVNADFYGGFKFWKKKKAP